MADTTITTRHPSYSTAQHDWWTPCRDAFEGEQAVRRATTRYVPLLEGCQTPSDDDYKRYLDRGTFYPAVERTVVGLTGMVLRKPAQVKVTRAIDVDGGITLYGEGLMEFVAEALREQLVVGRGGIAIDWSEKLSRPYWTFWKAERIINWSAHYAQGEILLDRIVLEVENYEPSPSNPYLEQKSISYRELSMVTPTGGGDRFAAARTWVEVESNGQKTWTPGQWHAYIRRGRGLPFIPFVFIGPHRPDPHVCKPPLLDLSLLNLSHWRTSCDYEYGLHFSALPTPYVTGYSSNTPLKIGSGVAWLIPATGAKVGMLEFTGQGLGAVEKALDRKERRMASIGARLLEDQSHVQETAEAVRLRHSGETSALGLLSRALSMSLTSAIRMHAYWQGFGDNVPTDKLHVQLNQDYLESRLSAQELDALVKTWQAGGISGKTLYWNLQAGEIARPNVEYEEEQKEIEAEMPEEVPPATPPVVEPARPGAPAPPEDQE